MTDHKPAASGDLSPGGVATLQDRVDRFQSLLTRFESLDDGSVAAALLTQAAQLWVTVLSTSSLALVPHGVTQETFPIQDTLMGRFDLPRIDETAAELESIDPSRDESRRTAGHNAVVSLETILRGVGRASADTEIPRIVTNGGGTEDSLAYRHIWMNRAHLLNGAFRDLDVIDRLKERTEAVTATASIAEAQLQVSTDDLRELAKKLQEARSESAQNQLAHHFGELAEKERMASNWFRGATGLLLLLAAIAGLMASSKQDWQEMAGHVIFALALSGASAYAARLGSLHRVTADWARTIKVQLDTFRDFLATVTDPDVKDRVYEEFGRRVLGAPPSSSGGDDTPPMSVAQVAELAAALASSRRN